MKHPVWLKELHRQWITARGNRITPSLKSFKRKWDELLTDAGLKSGEDYSTALREAEREEMRGHLKLHRVRPRSSVVLRIEVPLHAEAWLLSLFNEVPASRNLDESLKVVAEASKLPHSRFPNLWLNWCRSLEQTFRQGKNSRPLYWQSPGKVRDWLTLVYKLTSMGWQDGALIREVSVRLGLSSKELERRRLGMESCLRQMFNRPMPLQSVGVVPNDSKVFMAGMITLHFANGETQIISRLEAVYGLSIGDLERVQYVTSPAQRLLTIENSKTTMQRLVKSNVDASTLFLECAYPTRALQKLITLLPADIPIYHFGDTDPAGFQILLKLRQSTGRAVKPFLMNRREAAVPQPLSDYDKAILPRLLEESLLSDMAAHLQDIQDSGCKGDFEQETLGLPDQNVWPFFSRVGQQL